MQSNPIVTLQSLWRYPVKSMQGESLDASLITASGLDGDRAFALLDEETSHIASAKNPKKWPNMFFFHAHYENLKENKFIITLPNGSKINSADDNINTVLSDFIGRKVRLISEVPQAPKLEEYWPDIPELEHKDIVTDEDMPKGTFFDLANLHIVTTATLAELKRLYPEGDFQLQRFRPNLVLETNETGFIESTWVGKTITIGANLKLKITDHCPRCVMTTLPQGDLPQDRKILRTAARHNKAHVGVYAEIIQQGTVQCGDKVTILD
ncbi:MAG: MOSC domain-containing protein [Methylococcales bacterium]|nr:MOSC domain-containing protein [Methylococcales bacterium]